MSLLGKIKNKVHQGILGTKDAYVKLNEFIADHGQGLPYAVAAMAPYMWNIHPIGGIQMAVNAVALHKFLKDYNEKKKQDAISKGESTDESPKPDNNDSNNRAQHIRKLLNAKRMTPTESFILNEKDNKNEI